MSRNQLYGFDEELTDRLLKIESVRFEKNPFICDVCSMNPLLERQKEVSLIKLNPEPLINRDCLQQMRWKYMPTCFQPENLRGRPINRLMRDNLPYCFGVFADEGRGSAIISYNFLHQSRINVLALVAAAVFVLMLLIIIVSISICTRQRAHYYTREDGKGGKLSL